MSGFDADWLALREPADRAARDDGLLVRLAAALEGRSWIDIVDLGSGSGANLRALAPRLPGPQSWRLVDNDAALLEIALASAATVRDRDGRPPSVAECRADLAAPDWEAAAQGADVLAMSALLDLVDEGFLARLARLAREQGAILYAALTVDGRMGCTPADPLDEEVFAAFRAHMAGDKGFGPALGPDAPRVAAGLLMAHGFTVETARSDWMLGPREALLAAALLEGWGEAAGATGRLAPEALARWSVRRREEIAAGSLELRVGHVDLLAFPR